MSDLKFNLHRKNPVKTGFFLFVLLFLWVWTANEAKKDQQKVGRELIAPPRGIEHFHFGFRAPMADLLWVRAIQDFDFCEQTIQKNLCRGKGWLFQTLDVATNLDSHFRMVYSAGGMALSVIISDIEGASLIFDKGVQNFPNDWIILYKAAYHALYEEKNTEKAAHLMEAAAKNGAPDWVYILAGRLYTDAGRRELAERVLVEVQQFDEDGKMAERLRQKIQEGPSKTE